MNRLGCLPTSQLALARAGGPSKRDCYTVERPPWQIWYTYRFRPARLLWKGCAIWDSYLSGIHSRKYMQYFHDVIISLTCPNNGSVRGFVVRKVRYDVAPVALKWTTVPKRVRDRSHGNQSPHGTRHPRVRASFRRLSDSHAGRRLVLPESKISQPAPVLQAD